MGIGNSDFAVLTQRQTRDKERATIKSQKTYQTESYYKDTHTRRLLLLLLLKYYIYLIVDILEMIQHQ